MDAIGEHGRVSRTYSGLGGERVWWRLQGGTRNIWQGREAWLTLNRRGNAVRVRSAYGD